MDEAEVSVRLNAALKCLCERDLHLLNVDASERSMTHRLAVHLIEQFPDHDIDCEYNRDGFDVKRLELAERAAKDDDVEAVTVFPDIVVHRRGHNDDNLLVIEVKKRGSRISADYGRRRAHRFQPACCRCSANEGAGPRAALPGLSRSDGKVIWAARRMGRKLSSYLHGMPSNCIAGCATRDHSSSPSMNARERVQGNLRARRP
ncbi:MAG: hypothetical protein EKK47_16710 [Burkholderiales bacterium]|nr:MAG: hypothetical protein EKK47_16710 [Burkholderiales bacterium]